MDIFADYFTRDELILSLSKTQYVPGLLGADGLFDTIGLMGTKYSHQVDPDDDVSEMTALPRGAPGAPMSLERRTAYSFEITHGYPKRGAVTADEVLNARGPGIESAAMTVQTLRDRMVAKFRRFIDWQHEYLRVSCLNTPTNQLGSAPAAATIAFGTSDSAIRGAILDGITLPIESALGGIPYTGITAYCSETFWKGLIDSKTIRETYLNQAAAAELRNAPADTFDFGGVRWKRYRGGGNIVIAAGKAKAIPTGVPDLFKQLFAPNDTMDAVGNGQPGQPYYIGSELMAKGKGVELWMDTYPQMICLLPEAILTLQLTS